MLHVVVVPASHQMFGQCPESSPPPAGISSWRVSGARWLSGVTSSAASSTNSWADVEPLERTTLRLSRKKLTWMRKQKYQRHDFYFVHVRATTVVSLFNLQIIFFDSFILYQVDVKNAVTISKVTFYPKNHNPTRFSEAVWQRASSPLMLMFHGNRLFSFTGLSSSSLLVSSSSQWSSHEAPEGKDLDPPCWHLHQRLPVCACQSRVRILWFHYDKVTHLRQSEVSLIRLDLVFLIIRMLCDFIRG